MPPLFCADHIGSLIRPQYLLDAQAAVSVRGHLHTKYRENADQWLVQKAKDAEKRAIKDVVAEQVKRGIRPITSGEFERPSYVSGFFENLDGIEIKFLEWKEFRTGFPMLRPYLKRKIPGREHPIATNKVRWKESAYLSEWQYLQSLLPKERWKDVKITIPAPNWCHTQLKDRRAYTTQAYTDDEEYLRDCGEAVRQEVLALYSAGVRFIQIDDPMIAMCCDLRFLEAQRREGKDLDALLNPAISAHNAVAKGIPCDLILAVHLCRGNLPRGEMAAIGGFDQMARKLFNDMPYKRFALELDNPGITGSLSPLQYLPPGKVVVLGLITTKVSELESVAIIKSRILEAANIIAKAQGKTRREALRDNLAVSPSCGFVSLSFIHGVDGQEKQWQKLELLQKVVEEVWGAYDDGLYKL